jgi:gamma-glutamylcyclotransferase (GGCT)/AIG2-like uncharacterized protein YtfP
MIRFLFAYGTLHPKLAPPCVANAVRQLRLVGRGTARGVLYDLGEYPGAKFDAASPSLIHGLVYRLPQSLTAAAVVLGHLDEYESIESALFARQSHQVTLRSGRRLICWAYQYSQSVDGARVVAGGRYALRKISKTVVPPDTAGG